MGKSYMDPVLVIMCKYVRNESEIYGYVARMALANQLGLTTQVPAIIEIVTNREATNGRTIMVGNQKVRIKKQWSLFRTKMRIFYSFWMVSVRLRNIRN